MPEPLQFNSLKQFLPRVTHGFTLREPGLDVGVDRAEAMRRLELSHRKSLADSGLATSPLVTVEQVHSNRVAVVEPDIPFDGQGADAIVTALPGVCLGIYVADCCALFFVDPTKGVIGLAHSGRKGTELNIAGSTLQVMKNLFGCKPADIVVQLSPCIRPPDYETDFAEQILRQCLAEGVGEISDCGFNTAAHLDLFYSYRKELGKTGRMLGFLHRSES